MKVHLYLIRHGETVDNIAGLYAGVRDSLLTNYGHDQAHRLGDYLAKNNVKLTHIFASPLTRAFKTAELINEAQLKVTTSHDEVNGVPIRIVKVPDLIEQDFGFYEGKPFHARSSQSKNGRDEHREKHKNEPGYVDVESKDSMIKRAESFLDQHLVPVLDDTRNGDTDRVIALVSHGMLLSTLWRRLLLRLPRKSLTIAAEVTASRDALVLEHLGGWSNTGYLELAMTKDSLVQQSQVAPADLPPLEVGVIATPLPSPTSAIPSPAKSSKDDAESTTAHQPLRLFQGWATTILAVDSKTHLTGLKRQRGGIGRLAHDEGQRKLDGFFKKQKTG